MDPTRALKILIVDDEEIVRYTLGEILQMIGHSPDHQEDGQAGLHAIQNTTYDVAFIDIRMPGMGGIDLLQQALAVQPHLSIIVMSGHGDAETRQEAIQAGAFSFLYKPFRLKEIIDIIESVIRKKEFDG
jgi:two-component system nitrogen regulation response regulator NtrX